jgi:serine/threonine protein kinase
MAVWESEGLSGFAGPDSLDMLQSFGAIHAPVPKISEVPGVLVVLKMLGKGAYSEVWQCRVQGFQEAVAVKVLSQDLTTTESREAQLLKGVSHPNLIELLETLEGPPSALILTLCAGSTLHEFIHGDLHKASTAFTLQQRLKPALEVARAVTYLHSMEIIHRDIKPGNIFFTDLSWQFSSELPAAKLGDLGLARAVQGGAEMSKCVGTVLYMAPENMAQQPYNKPTDMFSLAIVVNELATCQRPYQDQSDGNKNLGQMALFILNGGRPKICDHYGLQEMLESCWHSDPSSRWPAASLVYFLENFF